MAKKKQMRFAENETFKHVIQPERTIVENQKFPLKGKWHQSIFKNNNPIILELGCGKGEYSVNLAKHFPNKNFIGIDIKGARFWSGAKEVQEKKLKNVVFLRSQIELIDQLFATAEIAEIWITFPDPQLKFKRAKHRLTHPIFLEKYQKILQKDGSIHLKTDSEFLHGYTQGIISAMGHQINCSNHHIYHPSSKETNIPSYVKEIKTHYENIYLNNGKSITYINFQFKS